MYGNTMVGPRTEHACFLHPAEFYLLQFLDILRKLISLRRKHTQLSLLDKVLPKLEVADHIYWLGLSRQG